MIPPVYRPPVKDIAKEEMAVGNVIKSLQLAKNKEGDNSELAVIKGLGADNHLREIWLRCQGYDYDFLTKRWIKRTEPIMNDEGIRNFLTILTMVLRMDFSNMNEDDIPRIISEFFSTNFTQFAVYHENFDLELKNINIIKTGCFMTSYIAARNAKNAGHRNVVRGTLSEQVFLKSMEGGDKKGSFLDKIFRRNKKETW